MPIRPHGWFTNRPFFEQNEVAIRRVAEGVDPYKVMSNLIKIRATNKPPHRFGGGGGYAAAYP